MSPKDDIFKLPTGSGWSITALKMDKELLDHRLRNAILGDISQVAFRLIGDGVALALMWWVVEKMFKQKDAPTPKQDILNRLKERGISLVGYETAIVPNIVDPEELTVGWSEVAGLDEVIEDIKRSVIHPIFASNKYGDLSKFVKPPKGVLLYGPPGCGKTMMAKAVAKEAKCWFINLDVAVLTDKWYGESEKLTAAVFSLAEKLQPCIIFIDEIDSLLRSRQASSLEVDNRIKTQIMGLWDGLLTDPGKAVILMGATNRPWDLDPAILRRLEKRIHIALPNYKQRRDIFYIALRDERISSDVDLDRLAKITEGFSGADLTGVVRSAVTSCLHDLLLHDVDGNGNISLLQIPSMDEVEEKTGSGWFSWLNPFSRREKVEARPVRVTVKDDRHQLRRIKMMDLVMAINEVRKCRDLSEKFKTSHILTRESDSGDFGVFLKRKMSSGLTA